MAWARVQITAFDFGGSFSSPSSLPSLFSPSPWCPASAGDVADSLEAARFKAKEESAPSSFESPPLSRLPKLLPLLPLLLSLLLLLSSLSSSFSTVVGASSSPSSLATVAAAAAAAAAAVRVVT